VKIYYMWCDCFINTFLSYITNNKNSIKTRENRRLELNLFSCVFQVIVATLNWISCGKHRCPGVQNCRDSSLCNWDSLLFHSFVDSDSVLWSHFIELINTYNATISKHHCTAFKLEITRSVIFNYSCC
jgi:hypothetical protein